MGHVVAVRAPAVSTSDPRKLLAEWRDDLYEKCENALTPQELHRRASRFLDFLDHAKIAFDGATTKDCRGYLSNGLAGKSRGTKRNYYETLRAWYKWLVGKKVIPSNPWEFSNFRACLEQAEHPDPSYPSLAPVTRIPHNLKGGFKDGVNYAPPEVERRAAGHLESWLKHLEAFGMNPRTRETYHGAVKWFLGFIQTKGKRFDHLDSEAFDEWLLWEQQERKLYVRTVNGHISAVRGFFRWLKNRGFILDNPAADSLKMLKAPRLLPRPISETGVMQILDSATKVKDRAMAETIYSTGARIGEMQAMSVGGVDLDKGTIITIGKYSRERVLYLNPPAIAALRAYLQWRRDSGENLTSSSPLWTGCRGRRMDIKSIRGRLKAIVHKSGIAQEVTPHQFRHSFCTHLLDHGADLRAVQELAGHDHIASTQIYTGVSPVRLGEAYRKAHPRCNLKGGAR